MAEQSKDPGSSYQTVCLDTALGKAYFELSPPKLQENYLEFHACIMVHSLVDDIDFVTALRTLSMDTDECEDPSAFRTSLCAVINHKVKEETRHGSLRKVLGSLVCRPENNVLRQDVEKLLEMDLKGAGIDFTPCPNIHAKAKLMAQHIALTHLPRKSRLPKKEFCVRLYKLRNCSIDNLIIEVLYFPYDIGFGLFLARLQDKTAFQRAKGGYTREEGQWQYRLSTAGRDTKEWHLLSDENSFVQMLERVKSADGQVSFCHDFLRNVIDKHVGQKEKDGDTCDSADEVLDENGLPFFDGSYMEYLASRP